MTVPSQQCSRAGDQATRHTRPRSVDEGAQIPGRLRSSCLINNYNYGRYIGEAVDSALAQSLPYDEIIVVDDGSTDDSLEVLHSRYGNHSNIRIVCHEQSGQLSCIQRAVELASGDVIFMLDSDDCHHRDLHAKVQSVYRTQKGVDFVSVGHQEFGSRANSRQRIKPTRDMGNSALAAVFFRHWVGAPTSCLSIRSSLLEKILPYPRESCWKTRADDVLVLGSSIMGAHKYHLGDQLVRYRVHEKNHYSGRKWSCVEKMQYALKLNAMINWYCDTAGYDVSLLRKLASKEFRTIERPIFKELVMYLRLCSQSRASWDVRIGGHISILKNYLTKRRVPSKRSFASEPVLEIAGETGKPELRTSLRAA